MSRDSFEQYVHAGLQALPERIRAEIRNVAFILSDEPTATQREENNLLPTESLFGLYEGVPLSERGNSDDIRLPDRITIFMKPILATYTDEADIRQCVINTIWHEVAHHFGHDEDWVETEERRRGIIL